MNANEIFAVAKLHFHYESDILVFKESEHWITPAEIAKCSGVVLGDCDDFASLCVFLGRRANLPFRFVLCNTELGDLHCVAESEGWILDNRQSDIIRRDDLDYEWLCFSGFEPGEPWHAYEG